MSGMDTRTYHREDMLIIVLFSFHRLITERNIFKFIKCLPKKQLYNITVSTFPMDAARMMSDGAPKGWTSSMMSLSDQPLSGSPVINTTAFCGRHCIIIINNILLVLVKPVWTSARVLLDLWELRSYLGRKENPIVSVIP